MGSQPKGTRKIMKLDQHEDLIRRMARLGYTVKETAAKVGVWEGTLSNYRHRKGITFVDGRGRHQRHRLRDPEVLAKQLDNLATRYEDHEPSEKWLSSKRRRQAARTAYKLIGTDTWLEMTTGSLMAKLASKERLVHYRLAKGQHLTDFELLI